MVSGSEGGGGESDAGVSDWFPGIFRNGQREVSVETLQQMRFVADQLGLSECGCGYNQEDDYSWVRMSHDDRHFLFWCKSVNAWEELSR